jgi:hypothetical protein
MYFKVKNILKKIIIKLINTHYLAHSPLSIELT